MLVSAVLFFVTCLRGFLVHTLTISQENEIGEQFRFIHHSDELDMTAFFEAVQIDGFNSSDLLSAITKLCVQIVGGAEEYGVHAVGAHVGTVSLTFNPRGF